MNSNPGGAGMASAAPRAQSATRAYQRIAIAIAVSLVIHVLFVSEVLSGLAGLFPWLTKGEPPTTVVNARIVTPPPPPPAPPQSLPEPSHTAASPTPEPAPVRRAAPRPRPVPSAPPVLSAPTEAVPAAVAADTGPQAGPAADAPAAATPVQAATAGAANPAPAPRTAPFPTRARIDFQITRDADNLTAYGVQDWRLENGRYRIRLDARLMFFSVAFESSGTQGDAGLRPEHYIDDRRGKVTSIDFSAERKNAQVNEANGNVKNIAMSGPAADLMSLPYDLALNPEMPVGTIIMLANRDSVDPARLTERREEVLMTERGPVNTRFYSFQYVQGSGSAQVWLALDKQWLPAKLRVSGRDGPISFMATGYKLD